MAYKIFYRERAKEEFEASFETYGSNYRDQMYGWLQHLSDEAERKQHTSSVDLHPLFELVTENPQPGPWHYAWKQWQRATLVEKLKALKVLLKKRSLPWELHGSIQGFMVLDLFFVEVHVLYEVDHVNRRIIFTLFSGLPGQ